MTQTGPTMLAPGLRLDVQGAVAVLTLARPQKRNALNASTVQAIGAFFTAPVPGVRAAVIHGEGPHFCAGLDLADIRANGASEGVFHSRLWHRAFTAIEEGTLPLVAALHGAVIGGGLELAATAHIRVAEASTFYALPEGQRGIYVGGGGSVRIPRLIGVARTTDMMLTGRTYGAAEGMAIGLSQYQTAAGEGLAKAMELAERIAGNTVMTNFAVMQVLPRTAVMDPAAGLLTESLIAAIAAADAEAKERLGAFLDRGAGKVVHNG